MAVSGGAAAAGRQRKRGQAIVELTLILPVFLFLLLTVLDFGMAFNHVLTLEYATREGARTGAALANGTGTDSACVANDGTSRRLTAADVDPLTIAAVQRVLESSGSLVNLGNVHQVVIFKADASGNDTLGIHNVWTYRPGNTSNPLVPCQQSAPHLDFYESSHGWDVCGATGNASFQAPCGSGGAMASARNNGGTPDDLGVRISYTYSFVTPIGAVASLAARASGGAPWTGLSVSDVSVMALEPTS